MQKCIAAIIFLIINKCTSVNIIAFTKIYCWYFSKNVLLVILFSFSFPKRIFFYYVNILLSPSLWKWIPSLSLHFDPSLGAQFLSIVGSLNGNYQPESGWTREQQLLKCGFTILKTPLSETFLSDTQCIDPFFIP